MKIAKKLLAACALTLLAAAAQAQAWPAKPVTLLVKITQAPKQA